MEAFDMAEQLLNLISDDSDAAEDFISEVRNVRTFEEAGILTWDKGLVVQMNDGSEYQITVVRSM